MNEPKRVDDITGKVERGPFGTGSKSERLAVWIETDQGRFVLRHKNGPTFDDKSLEKYIGRQVTCDGFIVDYMLLAERIRMLPQRK